MSAQCIRNRLDEILHFLHPFMSFVNCHMVNYLTDHLWDTHIPQGIKSLVKNESEIMQAIEIFWEYGNHENSAKCSDLSNFLAEARRYYLENNEDLLVSKDELQKLMNGTSKGTLSVKEFMSEKKRHEVETVAELVSDLVTFMKSRKQKEVYVVDAGDGKGYLSSRLALQNQIKVLGIDANEINTESAKKRSDKLGRAWNGLKERATIISQGGTPPRRRGKRIQNREKVEGIISQTFENYKLANEYITPGLDLINMVNDNFAVGGEDFEVCLCGLHTCGNLGPTCLKLFVAQNNVSALCNVGCCYHLLNEEFFRDEFFANQKIIEKSRDNGFPMSEYLRSRKIKLGRNARMLASQSIHRTIKTKDIPSQSLLYRALLEVLIRERVSDVSKNSTFQVGKVKNYANFREYFEKCDEKLGLNLGSLGDSVYESLLAEYGFEAKLLDLFYLIRMTFAPILETVILLDRLLFLKENNFDKSFIVPLFDPVVSPRCFGIVAMKI